MPRRLRWAARLVPRWLTLLLCALAAWAFSGPAAAQTLLSLEEARALAFPGARFEQRSLYPTEAQRERIAALLGQPLEQGLLRPYLARAPDGVLVGLCWLDTHRVRSKKESLLIAVDLAGRLLRIEVLAFAEPRDYLPRAPFYAQFVGLDLGPELDFGRRLDAVAGATLTAQATLWASRRALAIQRELFPPPPRWAFPARFACARGPIGTGPGPSDRAHSSPHAGGPPPPALESPR